MFFFDDFLPGFKFSGTTATGVKLVDDFILNILSICVVQLLVFTFLTFFPSSWYCCVINSSIYIFKFGRNQTAFWLGANWFSGRRYQEIINKRTFRFSLGWLPIISSFWGFGVESLLEEWNVWLLVEFKRLCSR